VTKIINIKALKSINLIADDLELHFSVRSLPVFLCHQDLDICEEKQLGLVDF
jgi:hypothetical protein